MRHKIKVTILNVSETLMSASVKSTTYKQILTVAEVPELNPYGKPLTDRVPFDVEIHNNNIAGFGVTKNHINELAEIDVLMTPYRKDGNSETQWKILVNGLDVLI
jgi:hypothetical protein